ncbi:hypothetical protein [Actinocrispum sp. NPDC049592]|uniref:alpha/beta fold hydrolase n=1 Tax=Actinocrispum sp. NPDC049592 TaxID=3154835 RepID=UPI003442C213
MSSGVSRRPSAERISTFGTGSPFSRSTRRAGRGHQLDGARVLGSYREGVTLTHYRTTEIDGLSIFYREAGDPVHPTILLLHGFPASSFVYRELIGLLTGRVPCDRPRLSRVRAQLGPVAHRVHLHVRELWNFRTHEPPTLIVWGRNDTIFPESGAHPFTRDLTDIDLNLLNTGHFALEDHAKR